MLNARSGKEAISEIIKFLSLGNPLNLRLVDPSNSILFE
jgi:hypothetical protein